MNVNTRSRFIIFTILIVALFATLFVQLIQLTLVNGEEYAEMSSALTQREITVSGARGSILDRNGLPLAYDQKSYDVQFQRDPNKNKEIDKAYYTGIIIDTIEIVERNGGKTINTFAIDYNEQTGEYYFSWGDISASAAKDREANWRENMYIRDTKTKIHTAEEIYKLLRVRYQIPSEMSYEEARKVLSIWQDVQLASWVAYKPIDIAYNVSIQAVAEIETHRDTLEGMTIADSTVRIYPRDAVAAHTIGYLGRIIDADQLNEYQLMGYKVDDLVGVEGIEESMEAYLSGNSTYNQGKRVVEIDNMAVIVNDVSATQPKQGDNVMLTIDIPLQQALEESLATNIPRIKQEQIDAYIKEQEKGEKSKYKDIESIEDIALAESGAAVVLDVNNGEVLAMGSYPSFDLNLFTGGIDPDIAKELFKDPATPMFNKAVASKAHPGSIFKMVTGLAGLMEEKITLNTIINCEDEYHEGAKEGAEVPECWTSIPRNHQNQTIVEGLMNSCNYFFYTVADRLGVELVSKWGDKFGLTESTGIEIPGEVIGQIYEPNILYDNTKPIDEQMTWSPYLVKKRIIEQLYLFAEDRQVEFEDQMIEETADELLYLAGLDWGPDEDDNDILKDSDGVSMGEHVRSILQDRMDISTKTSIAYNYHGRITSFLEQLKWAQYDTVTTGIGQGVVQVTPIAVARYVAALVNGGTVYETHVVDKIVAQDGTIRYDKQKVVFDTLDAPQEYLDKIMLGMAEVVSGEDGTAAERFKNYKYKDMIGGKTGTAQVSTIDLENNSWFVCFAPFDAQDSSVKPEIAVVVYVPNGLSGGQSSLVAQDIVEFYLDRKKDVAEQTIPDSNAIVPMPGASPTTQDDETDETQTN